MLEEKDVLCPLRYTLDIVGGKWKLPILCILADKKPRRYSEIKKKIPDITNMMLSQSLKELESHGIITRKQYNEVPPRVEYHMNDGMEELLIPLRMLGEWGSIHMHEEGKHIHCEECKSR